MEIKERRYATRRSAKPVLPFIAGAGVFIPIGVGIIATGDSTSGLGFLLFGSVFLLILFIQVLAPGSSYRINPSGLVLKRGGSRRVVPFSEIAAAGQISDDVAKGILAEYMEPAMRAEGSLDLRAWLKSNTKYGKLVRYCTVPIVQSKTTVGSRLNIVDFKAKTHGSFTLVRLSSGEKLLLSPSDTQSFTRELLRHGASEADIRGPNPYRGESADTVTAAARRVRGLRTLNLLTFVVLVGAVVAYILLRNEKATETAESTESAVQETAVEFDVNGPTGWISPDVFRTKVEITRDDSFIKDIEQRRKQLRDFLYSTYRYDVIGNLIAAYVIEKNIELDQEQYARVHGKVEQLFEELPPTLVHEEIDDKASTIISVIDINADGLRKTAEELIKETLTKKEG